MGTRWDNFKSEFGFIRKSFADRKAMVEAKIPEGTLSVTMPVSVFADMLAEVEMNNYTYSSDLDIWHNVSFNHRGGVVVPRVRIKQGVAPHGGSVYLTPEEVCEALTAFRCLLIELREFYDLPQPQTDGKANWRFHLYVGDIEKKLVYPANIPMTFGQAQILTKLQS